MIKGLFKKFKLKTSEKQQGITKYFIHKATDLEIMPEASPGKKEYSMFNSGGVEIEVGEFLYSFVKMIKPESILETGTHYGISALYMGQALKENNKGSLVTLEIFHENIDRSKKLWRQVGVAENIKVLKRRSMDYVPEGPIDILFLDSEPDIRFDEFVRFYDSVVPGGYILIHDLHPNLGISNVTLHGMENWPYGDFRPKLGRPILDFSLQTFSFRTPRGFTMFQKSAPDFSHSRFLKENYQKVSQSFRP